MAKKITLLGSTGSIGTQSLDVIRAEGFEVFGLSAHSHVELLLKQIEEFHPRAVCVTDPAAAEKADAALAGRAGAPRLLRGPEGLRQLAAMEGADIVLNSVVGIAGLGASLAAIESGHDLALANKESLVTGGRLVTRAVEEHGVRLLPVDSEHSAIFQCLAGEGGNPIEKILLTASGGPFREFSLDRLATVTKADALHHPTWDMGAKITIDSATMMNKGFEVIEAKWLFGVEPQQIQVLVHPQSIVHSAVQFCDGAVKAQLGVPDMRLPIQYAFAYPERISLSSERLDLLSHKLEFFEPDTEKFRCLALAFEAIGRGGNMPCILNAANEVVNRGFLEGRCGFLQMSDIIAKTMERVAFDANPTYETYTATDAEARRVAAELMDGCRRA